MRSEDQPSRVLYELCSLLLSVLRSPYLAGPEMPPPPPLTAWESRAVAEPRPARRPRPQLSPTGLASLLLGMSLAMMFCGSVTFAIGFILMPWVLGMVMVLGFMAIVSNLSGLGRAILCLGFPSASRVSSNEVPENAIASKPWVLSAYLGIRSVENQLKDSNCRIFGVAKMIHLISVTCSSGLFSRSSHEGQLFPKLPIDSMPSS